MKWQSTIIAFIWDEYPEGGCFPREKTTSRGLTIWCSPHTKAITALLYRKYSGMFYNLNVMFWRKQNNFRYRKCNYGTGLHKTNFRWSGVSMNYCLPVHYMCFGCSSGCFPRQQSFFKTSKMYCKELYKVYGLGM
jgi:hypothetical protein